MRINVEEKEAKEKRVRENRKAKLRASPPHMDPEIHAC
jgi:hypothetical protein